MELLVTISIITTISIIIVPYIQTYQEKARLETDSRNLKSFQTSIVRHIALKEDFDFLRWTGGSTTTNSSPSGVTNNMYLVPGALVSTMVGDMAGTSGLTDAAEYVTLEKEDRNLTFNNVNVVRSGFSTNYAYEVWRFRKTSASGIDRKQNKVTDWNDTSAATINAAFN